MRQMLAFSLFLLASAAFFGGCNKSSSSPAPPGGGGLSDSTGPPAPAVIRIISIRPTSGPSGIYDTITGTGFNNPAFHDSVDFNGKQAMIYSESATQIVVGVPTLCGTGPVTVKTSTSTAGGPTFTYDTTWSQGVFATGFSNGQYEAIDNTGNLYVTDIVAGTVTKIGADGTVSTFASGFLRPLGIVADKGGNLFVADNNHSSGCNIYKISPSGVVDSFSTVSYYVYGLTIDGGDNLYAANNDGNICYITKVTLAGLSSNLASDVGGGVLGTGLTIDGGGNLYLGEGASIYVISPAGAVSSIQMSGAFSGANSYGLAISGSGDLFATDYFNNCVYKVSATGITDTIATGIYEPKGIVPDKSGNLFVVCDTGPAEGPSEVIKLSIR